MGEYSRIQRQSRRIALCGLLAALSVAILSLGSLIPFATFACPMLAMICLLPIVCDYATGTALLVYAASAVLGVLLCADKELALLYVFLGWYPAFRPRLERLPRLPRTGAKSGLFCLAVTAMYVLILHLFRLDAVVEEFAEYSAPMLVGLLVMGCLVFLIFDRALGVLSLVYRQRRKRR